MFRVSRLLFEQLILAVALAAVVLLLTQDILFEIAPLKRLELATLDLRFQARGPVDLSSHSAQVIIVEISHESFQSLPDPWPWPRSYYARLVRHLKRAGALAVGIDLVFTEPNLADPGQDEDFRNAIRETGFVVLAGKTDLETGQYLIRREDENYGTIFFDVDSSVGIVYVRNDEDGIYRRYRPFTFDRAAQRRIPTFAFAVLNKVHGKPPFFTAENTPTAFIYAGRAIPKADPVSIFINYYGPNRTFRHVKFADVIDDHEFQTLEELELGEDINTFDDPDYGYLHDGTFEGKIVLVGSTMPEDKDLFPVPMAAGEQFGDNLMYGVELHANMLQNVLDGNYLRLQPKWMEVLSIVLLCLIAFLSNTRFKELKLRHQFISQFLGVAVVILLLFLLWFISTRLFSDLNFVMILTTPALAIVVGFVGATVYNYMAERKQKVLIKGMFSQYVNPTVVEELVAHPEKLRLGGERRELTVMFTDIEGFTSIAERMEPEKLVDKLNEYLTVMTSIIFSNEGTLDKYEGDAIMAFWGAPVPQGDHALRACRAAVEMQDALRLLHERWHREKDLVFHVRIGISTGEMIVGNMGGIGRFDYTVIGDSVNLGARLESANKQYRTRIMISESTYKHVRDLVVARQLDLLQVKGKTEPTAVYELVGLAKDSIPPERLRFLELYERGLELYRNRQWEQASTIFQQAMEIVPDDYPCYLYIERAGIYQKTPPPPDWNGVFILRTK